MSLERMGMRLPAAGWRACMRPRPVLTALLACTLLIFLARLPKPREKQMLVAADGVGYYSYLRSLAIDRDLDFSNEYEHFEVPEIFREPRAIGRPGNRYAAGSAVLWAPFFFVAHALAYAARAIGFPVVPNGYGYLYEGAIAIGTIVYGFLGFVLSWRCARRMVAESSALAAVVVLWLASNALYYMIFEPSMAHMNALFAVALALSIWFFRFRQAQPPSRGAAALLGVAAGLVLLVRLQDAVFLLVPYGYCLGRALQAWRAEGWQPGARWLAALSIAGVVALLCFLPQLVVWQRLYGNWITSPYAYDQEQVFFWLAPRFGAVLFSTFHGLFTWHPIYLVAFAGLLLLAKREPLMSLSLVASLALQTYVIASWWFWWQGAAFGGRMFLSAMWIWVLGVAAAIEWLRGRRALMPLAAVVAIVLVAWNVLSLLQYRLLLVPANAPLTWRQMTIERFHVVTVLWRRLID